MLGWWRAGRVKKLEVEGRKAASLEEAGSLSLLVRSEGGGRGGMRLVTALATGQLGPADWTQGSG